MTRPAGSAAGLQALLFVLALALSGFTVLRGIGPHDEGLMLQAAARIADGQLPWRDFWWNYGPGQPLLLGGLTEVFGPSLLTWRIVRVVLDATVALLAHRLVLREAPMRLALLAWLAVAAAMAWPAGPGPNPAALALGLGALLLAGRDRGEPTPRTAVAAGVLAGVAILFRPEIGIACALGAVLAARRVTVLVAAALTAVVLWAPFVVVAPGAFADDLVGFLAIQDLQRLPFPPRAHPGLDPNKVLETFFPVVLVAAAALAAVVAAVRRPPPSQLALVPLALAGLAYLLARADEFHLVPLSVALAVLLGALAGRERTTWVRYALIGAVSLISAHGLDRRAGQALHPPRLAAVPEPAGDGVRTDPAEAEALGAVLAAVRGRTRPGEPIFVANPRHDLVRVGNPLVYVLAGRPNPTRYDVMQPGVVTTEEVQREIVTGLREVDVVVRWIAPTASEPEPNGAGRSSGVVVLDRYLRSTFRPVAAHGDFEVLVRVGSER